MEKDADKNSHGNTILVVDDHRINRSVLSNLLVEFGYKVLCAEGGRQALDMAAKEKPDLILLDIRMPDIDGHEVCRRLKVDSALSDIPVLFISALHDLENKSAGFKMGAVDYISKPFEFEEVLSRINVHITIKNLKKELESTNQKLESMVEERTAELRIVNEGLEKESAARQSGAEKLQRVNCALMTLWDCSHAITHAKSEEGLVDEVCRIIVEEGGYRLAWVGYAQNDSRKTVKPVASAGFEDGYLENIDVVWSDTERGRGPAGASIRTGRPVVINDIHSDERFKPWRSDAEKRGYASSIGLPLFSGSEALGSITIYSERPDAFDLEERELLKKLAEDLSYGIAMQRMHEARKRDYEEISKLSAAVTQSPASVVITDTEGKIEFVNPKFTEVTGYAFDEVVGQNPRILKSGEIADEVYAELWKTISSGGVWHGEMHNKTKNGDLYWESASISPILDKNGKITHFVAVKEDITERKIREERLNSLEKAFENTSTGVVVSNIEGVIRYVNPAQIKMSGYEESELLGQRAGIFSPPEIRKPLTKKDIETFKSGVRESINMRKDGSVYPVKLTSDIVKDKDGNPHAIVTTALDISLRKAAEDRLRSSEERLKRQNSAIAEMTRIEVSGSLDMQGVMNNLLELTARTLDVERVGVWFFNEDRSALNCTALYDNGVKELGEGLEIHQKNYPAYFKTMTENHILALKDALNDEGTDELKKSYLATLGVVSLLDVYIGFGGDASGVICCEHRGELRDWHMDEKNFASAVADTIELLVTMQEMLKREIALQRSREELRSLALHVETVQEEERKKIARDIHDELGQVLTVFKFDLAWVAKRLPEYNMPVREKIAQTTKMIELAIENVQKIAYELRPILLDDLGLVQAMDWQVNDFIKRTGIACKLSIKPETILLDGDLSTELFRIFQESLTNVARHSDATEAEVKLECDSRQINLHVKDNGRGIKDEEIDDIKSIGLIGIRERIRPWKGKIDIKGEPGKGTLLSISIDIE